MCRVGSGRDDYGIKSTHLRELNKTVVAFVCRELADNDNKHQQSDNARLCENEALRTGRCHSKHSCY